MSIGLKSNLKDEFIFTTSLFPLLKGVEPYTYKKLFNSDRILRKTEANKLSGVYMLYFKIIIRDIPVGCGCRISRLHLCRGIIPSTSNVTKLCDGGALALDISRIYLLPSSPL